MDGVRLLSAMSGNTSAASATKSTHDAVAGEDEGEMSTLEHPNVAGGESR